MQSISSGFVQCHNGPRKEDPADDCQNVPIHTASCQAVEHEEGHPCQCQSDCDPVDSADRFAKEPMAGKRHPDRRGVLQQDSIGGSGVLGSHYEECYRAGVGNRTKYLPARERDSRTAYVCPDDNGGDGTAPAGNSHCGEIDQFNQQTAKAPEERGGGQKEDSTCTVGHRMIRLKKLTLTAPDRPAVNGPGW